MGEIPKSYGEALEMARAVFQEHGQKPLTPTDDDVGQRRGVLHSPVLEVGMRVQRVDDRIHECERGITWTAVHVDRIDQRAILSSCDYRVPVGLDEDGRLERGRWREAPPPRDQAADCADVYDAIRASSGSVLRMPQGAAYDAVLRPSPGVTVCIGTCDGTPPNAEEVERSLRKALGTAIGEKRETTLREWERDQFGDVLRNELPDAASDQAEARRQVLIESATPPPGVTVEAWRHTLGAMLEDRDPETGLAWCDTAEEVEDGAAFMRWAYPKLRGGR